MQRAATHAQRAGARSLGAEGLRIRRAFRAHRSHISLLRSAAMKIQTALFLSIALPEIAFAQVSSESATLEEVIVTSQRREQPLQDVPVAVTALTEREIQ